MLGSSLLGFVAIPVKARRNMGRIRGQSDSLVSRCRGWCHQSVPPTVITVVKHKTATVFQSVTAATISLAESVIS